MNDDVPSSLDKSTKQGNNSPLIGLRKMTRGMDGYIAISRKLQVIYFVGQARKLMKPQGGKLYRRQSRGRKLGKMGGCGRGAI